jgi:hypothetical protein
MAVAASFVDASSKSKFRLESTTGSGSASAGAAMLASAEGLPAISTCKYRLKRASSFSAMATT